MIRHFLNVVAVAALVTIPACKPEQKPQLSFQSYPKETANWGFAVEGFQMVFLVRPEKQAVHSLDSIAAFQERHLALLNNLKLTGRSLVHGPFDAAAGEPFRGMVLFPGTTPEDSIRAWLAKDAFVANGLLELRIQKWWTGDSLLFFAKGVAK
jgi:uncharacterized protein YciI